jgi:4'-phosphopantetheinyl transferase
MDEARGQVPAWRRALHPPRLGPGDVDVWRAEIGLAADRLAVLDSLLTEDERQKACAFRLAADRVRFVVGRGVLRTVLGDYLGEPPAALGFVSGEHGKPALVRSPAEPGLQFNVSHSEGLVLVAVADGVDVGVDVQWVRPDFDWERIAARFFSSGEVAALRALPGELARDAFFACWTHKEAYVKARGEGLQRSFDRFTVLVTPGVPAVALRADDDPAVAARWSLHTLEVGEGYAAALAVGSPDRRVRCWQWE